MADYTFECGKCGNCWDVTMPSEKLRTFGKESNVEQCYYCGSYVQTRHIIESKYDLMEQRERREKEERLKVINGGKKNARVSF